ncbi:MAG: hypothetical protein N2109_05405 [Fimbriimonadales bacterium]|nr:hypothetical protein [Fimbriimonadales bacterium]
MRASALLAGLLAGALAVDARTQGQPSASQLLRWVTVGPEKPFQAKQRVVLRTEGRSLESGVEVYFAASGRVRREYLIGATKLVVLQLGRESWQTVDGSRWTRVAAGGLDPGEALRRAAGNYSVSRVRRGKLLGRDAVGFELLPRHEGNPWREVWLAADTGWPLAETVYSPDGRVRSSTKTLRIAAWRPEPSLLQKPAAVEAPTASGPTTFEAMDSLEAVERAVADPVPLPNYVPPGYSVAAYGVVRSHAGRLQPAVRYSDGLSSFTVFRRFGGGGFGPGGRFQRGRAGGAGQGGGPPLRSDEQRSVVQHRGVRGTYVLIGDLAESQLRRVAESLP